MGGKSRGQVNSETKRNEVQRKLKSCAIFHIQKIIMSNGAKKYLVANEGEKVNMKTDWLFKFSKLFFFFFFLGGGG